MASINDLDNPLLVLILNRLCIQKLFTAGHVCVRWNAMRDISAHDRQELGLMVGENAQSCIDKSIFEYPKQQKLVDENGDVMFPENDQNDFQLKIHSFPLDFARLVSPLFYNLNTLIISTRELNANIIDSISHLLEQFNQPNGPLHTLKLYSNQDDPNPELNENQTPTCLRLISTVNSIGSLRKLAFDVNAKFSRYSIFSRIDLSILAQLEEFEFNSADEQFSCLFYSIRRYAENNQRLRRIGIGYSTDNLDWFLALPTELSSSFTHLHLCLDDDNEDLFKDVCLHLGYLTSLEITLLELTNFNNESLFRPLTHLPNLLSFVINIDGYTFDFNALRTHYRAPIKFRIPSVKVLSINMSNSAVTHYFLEQCDMNHLFPNIQVIRVNRDFALCVYCFSKRNNVNVIALEEHCARHMFRDFAHCQHLRMVCSKVTEGEDVQVIGPRYRQWAWSEMGPFEDEVKEEAILNMKN